MESALERNDFKECYTLTILDIHVHFSTPSTVLTLGRTSEVTPPPWCKGGGGNDGIPLLGFCCGTIFRKDFTFAGRKYVRIRYILWVAAARFGRHLGFYPKLKIIKKSAEIDSLWCWTVEYDIVKHFDGLVNILCFTHLKKMNKHYYSKVTWPPATYDVVSLNHSKWFLQNRQVQTKTLSWKNSTKTLGGVGGGWNPPPSPSLVSPKDKVRIPFKPHFFLKFFFSTA